MTSTVNTIRNIIVEDKNIDLDAWSDPSYQLAGDGATRKSLEVTPAALDTIINSPRLLALLAAALKPHLDTITEE
tara:strand:+ start:485 stop:709 length:225 start_codon:yes stop_codon:yes gene_type:complete